MLVPHLLELLQLVGPSWLPAEHDGVYAVPESLRNIISTTSVEDPNGSAQFSRIRIRNTPNRNRSEVVAIQVRPINLRLLGFILTVFFETLYKYGLDSTKIRRQQ
jgi:hypothetical protein